MPAPEDFRVVAVDIDQPGDGQILVRNLFMSVDPYMRGRMIDRESYVPPFQLGEALTGGCVGVVEASNSDRFAVGDHVLGMNGWREFWISDGEGVEKVDPSVAPVQSYLGVLGMPGLTAYVGLLDIGALRDGETVFVSGAAGAVGSVACQIARIHGCRVIGSAGSAAKTEWLASAAGVDETIDYRETDDLRGALAAACPDGLDVYFDNVGGNHLEAALDLLNTGGRVVACGSISTYNATEPQPGPRNLFRIVTNRLTADAHDGPHRIRGPLRRIRRRRRRLDRVGGSGVGRDDPRRYRGGAGRVPRVVQRRESREDARPTVGRCRRSRAGFPRGGRVTSR